MCSWLEKIMRVLRFYYIKCDLKAVDCRTYFLVKILLMSSFQKSDCCLFYKTILSTEVQYRGVYAYKFILIKCENKRKQDKGLCKKCESKL